MIDKGTLRELFKAYQDLKLVTRVTTIKEEKGGKIILISNRLTADEWGLKTQTEQPDVDRTGHLLEQERQRIAKQIFMHLIDALEEDGSKDEFNGTVKGGQPELDDHHHKLISYARRACYHLGIFTFREYTEMSAVVDEQGILMGMRQHAKQPDDIMDEAM